MLQELNDNGEFTAKSDFAFALTPALREFYTSGDEEEIAHRAFQDAAEASLRILSAGDVEKFPHRRVVISADLDSVTPRPEQGESVVELASRKITRQEVAAIHIDVETSEDATKAAMAVIDEADLGQEDAEFIVGDAQDNFLAWYDPAELQFLVDLL